MKSLFLSGIYFFVICSSLFGQITFDYSAVELVLGQFTEGQNNTESIINHPGYQHILAHSRKYSSEPLTEINLRNSINGKNEGFDFSHTVERKDQYLQIIKFLKDNEQEITDIYAKLCKEYLPDNYQQKADLYYVIGGYNGIAFSDKICMNIDFKQFRENNQEILLYIAHELFHIGFEKFQALPDILKAKTLKDLRSIVLTMTMNEGLATLTPYHKRIEINEITDNDYKVLLDSVELQQRIKQFNSIIKYLDDNIEHELTYEILGNVLGQCSGERLFYIVGCYIGLKIEKEYGSKRIRELIEQGPDKYFETYFKMIETQ